MDWTAGGGEGVGEVLYNVGVGVRSSVVLYNVIWGRGGQKVAILALYNLCTASMKALEKKSTANQRYMLVTVAALLYFARYFLV